MKKLLLIPLLLVACSDKKALTAEKAQAVILADQAATQQICTSTVVRITNDLPSDYEPSAEKESFFQEYRVLEKYGYVKIDQRVVENGWGDKVKALHVEPTPKLKSDFGNLSDLCIGTWKASKVDDFTPPAEVAGLTMSQVEVSGQQEFTGWAKNADLRKALGINRELPPVATKTYTLVLKDSGWQVTGVE